MVGRGLSHYMSIVRLISFRGLKKKLVLYIGLDSSYLDYNALLKSW